jgi:hypothetical protein
MKKKWSGIFVFVCTLALVSANIITAHAQSEVKEKPPMYTYIASWAIPRAQWADMAKGSSANQSILEKALADGTLIGYGYDVTEVHQVDGATHDNWWSSMSMAGLMNVLESFGKSASSTSPVLASATKHWDNITVSRYYNWHPGSFKNAYTRAASYKLKPEAPDGALDLLSKTLFVPLLEEAMADGSVLEYEIDTEAIHTDSPSMFMIVIVTPNAEGLDKFDATLREAMKMNPLGGPALGSMIDFSGHRDYLDSSTGTYK